MDSSQEHLQSHEPGDDPVKASWEDVILRTLRKLHPSVFKSIRGKHIKALISNAIRSLKGQGPI